LVIFAPPTIMSGSLEKWLVEDVQGYRQWLNSEIGTKRM